jgi:adenylosuccinate synthase
MNEALKRKLDECRWFRDPGAYVLVDGQYGSTGKGLIAGALAECYWDRVTKVVCNFGPNSGHTVYHNGDKIVLKQLPTFAVIACREARLQDRAWRVPTVLSAGAVINEDLLDHEIHEHNIWPVIIHPCAAVISESAKKVDTNAVFRIASTGQGVGPALEYKLQRRPEAVRGPAPLEVPTLIYYRADDVVFVEVPQGFSLGINSGFYPHTTSRECSVLQAMTDAQMHPAMWRKTLMVVRTFPIRVGNTENTSGPCYHDQSEQTWVNMGLEPETTTVTGRVRRVFTWSKSQFKDAVRVNLPGVIFLNFCNYLTHLGIDVDGFVQRNVLVPYSEVMAELTGVAGARPEAVLLGFGPKSEDIRVWEG